MNNKLNNLILEIISFGDAMNFADTPVDSDFQHACYLFSTYLDDQFTEISTRLQDQTNATNINWNINDISLLNKLATLPANDHTVDMDWVNSLSMHCEKLHRNKIAAA